MAETGHCERYHAGVRMELITAAWQSPAVDSRLVNKSKKKTSALFSTVSCLAAKTKWFKPLLFLGRRSWIIQILKKRSFCFNAQRQDGQFEIRSVSGTFPPAFAYTLYEFVINLVSFSFFTFIPGPLTDEVTCLQPPPCRRTPLSLSAAITWSTTSVLLLSHLLPGTKLTICKSK